PYQITRQSPLLAVMESARTLPDKYTCKDERAVSFGSDFALEQIPEQEFLEEIDCPFMLYRRLAKSQETISHQQRRTIVKRRQFLIKGAALTGATAVRGNFTTINGLGMTPASTSGEPRLLPSGTGPAAPVLSAD